MASLQPVMGSLSPEWEERFYGGDLLSHQYEVAMMNEWSCARVVEA